MVRISRPRIISIAALSIGVMLLYFSAAAEAQFNENYKASSTVVLDIKTQPYTLKSSETLTDILEKFNLSLEEIKELNEFREYKNGIENISGGDEVNVPLHPIQHKDENTLTKNEQKTENIKLANITKNFGEAGSKKAIDVARDITTSEASSRLNSWLSMFGTSRLKLDIDENFTLKNSQLDFLTPVLESENWLLFTQESYHRMEERSQLSLGLGYRYYDKSYLLGTNIFGDYDLTRNHARAGFGVEYWRDFIKLSSNIYLRITDWKDSKGLEGYEERPANGWDLQINGFLPIYPKLGARLLYEQYYGNEVAIFGEEHRQKNPNAVTFGLNYTPIPLVTLNAEQREGKNGRNEGRISFDVNYRLGETFSHQINGNYVAQYRLLSGSKYDFVERNNNIILEYRKKDFIRLRLAPTIDGKSGDIKDLGVEVKTMHRLKHINFYAPELYSNGGKIIERTIGKYDVLLPSYNYNNRALNTYSITAVAYDEKGNSSNLAKSQINVTSQTHAKVYAKFNPEISTMKADGVSVRDINLLINGINQEPLDLPESAIRITTLSNNRKSEAKFSQLKKIAKGVYKISVHAGKVKELINIEAIYNEDLLGSAKVQIGDMNGNLSTFDITPKVIDANGNDKAIAKITIKNLNGEVVKGIEKSLSLKTYDDKSGIEVKSPDISLSSFKEIGNGDYIAEITGIRKGDYRIVPFLNNSPLNDLKDYLKLVAIEPDSALSEFIIKPKEIFADDIETALLTFKAKDRKGNKVSGISKKITFEVIDKKSGKKISPTDVMITGTIERNGEYIAQLSGRRAGLYQVIPLFNNKMIGNIEDSVTLKEDIFGPLGSLTLPEVQGPVLNMFDALGGTPVRVPFYAGMSQGDTISLNYYVTGDKFGNDHAYKTSHSVGANEVGKYIDILIPQSVLKDTGTGSSIHSAHLHVKVEIASANGRHTLSNTLDYIIDTLAP